MCLGAGNLSGGDRNYMFKDGYNLEIGTSIMRGKGDC